jgi:signal transduction histidine kinase
MTHAGRVEALSRLLNVGVLFLDGAGKFEFADATARVLLGCRSEEEAPADWSQVKHSIETQGAWSEHARDPARLVLDIPARDGVRSLRLEIYPLDEASGGGFLVLLKDRRTVDGLEAHLLQASQIHSLVHVYRALAHDLRAPLNSMQLTLDLLAEPLGDEATNPGSPPGRMEHSRRYIAILQEELARLNGILKAVLEKTEPASAGPCTFDLREIVKEASRLLSQPARSRGVSLHVQVPDQPVLLSGYRDHIRQALFNLGISCLEATSDGGLLTVRLSMQDATASVVFRDNGSGFPESANLYQVYPAADRADDAIGPYVARLAVESHGGDIHAATRPGNEARFSVTLPLERPVSARHAH